MGDTAIEKLLAEIEGAEKPPSAPVGEIGSILASADYRDRLLDMGRLMALDDAQPVQLQPEDEAILAHGFKFWSKYRNAWDLGKQYAKMPEPSGGMERAAMDMPEDEFEMMHQSTQLHTERKDRPIVDWRYWLWPSTPGAPAKGKVEETAKRAFRRSARYLERMKDIPGPVLEPPEVKERRQVQAEQLRRLELLTQAKEGKDPIEPPAGSSALRKMIEGGLYGAIQSAPYMALAVGGTLVAGPVGGAAAVMTQTYPAEYDKLRGAGVSIQNAERIAMLTGGANAGIEMLIQIPGIPQKGMGELVSAAKGEASRFITSYAVNSAGQLAGEASEEFLQSLSSNLGLHMAKWMGEKVEAPGVAPMLSEATRDFFESIPALVFQMGPGVAAEMHLGAKATAETAKMEGFLKALEVEVRQAAQRAETVAEAPPASTLPAQEAPGATISPQPVPEPTPEEIAAPTREAATAPPQEPGIVTPPAVEEKARETPPPPAAAPVARPPGAPPAGESLSFGKSKEWRANSLETARAFLQENPEAAKAIAAEEHPSRKPFQQAKILLWDNKAPHRERFAAFLREALRESGQKPQKPVAFVFDTAAPKHENPADNDYLLGGAGWFEGNVIKTIHVTSNPETVLATIKSGKPLTVGRGGLNVGDMGGGLYASAAPQLWYGRAQDKYSFLSALKPEQVKGLAEKIEAEIDKQVSTRYISASEAESAKMFLNQWRSGKGSSSVVTMLADQPYNISFWKPEFLKDLNIEPGKQPLEVPVELSGKFARVEHGHLTEEEVAALRKAGYDGAYAKSGFVSYPQIVVWNNAAVVKFGDWTRKGVSRAEGAARRPGQGRAEEGVQGEAAGQVRLRNAPQAVPLEAKAGKVVMPRADFEAKYPDVAALAREAAQATDKAGYDAVTRRVQQLLAEKYKQKPPGNAAVHAALNMAAGEYGKAQLERAEPALPAEKFKVGKATEIMTATQGKVAAKYALIESSDLTLAQQSQSVKDLQTRKYAPGDLEFAKVLERAEPGKFIPAEQINAAPSATTGPSIVTPEGVILSGNSREMTRREMAAKGNYGLYQDYLREHAAEYGINPSEIDAMKQPVLVRMVDVKAASPQAAKLVTDWNIPETMTQSPVRQAAAISRLIDNSLVANIEFKGKDTFASIVTDKSRGKAFREALRLNVPDQIAATYFTDTGDLTQAGVEFARYVLLTKVLPVETVEAAGDTFISLRNVVEAAVPQFLRIQRDMPTYDAIPYVREAADFLLAHPEATKKSIDDILYGQATIMPEFQERLSGQGRAWTEILLDHLGGNSGKTATFRNAMSDYAMGLDNEFGPTPGMVDRGKTQGQIFDQSFIDKPRKKNANRHAKNIDKNEKAVERGVGSDWLEMKSGGAVAPISVDAISATWAREWGFTRVYGDLHRTAAAIYKDHERVIQVGTPYAHDLWAWSHEAAHHMWLTGGLWWGVMPENVQLELAGLDYDKKRQAPEEGFGEFMAHYMVTENVAEKAPATLAWFQKEMRDRPEWGRKVDRIHQLIRRWIDQGAYNIVMGQISQTGKPAAPLDVPTSTLMREWIHRYGVEWWVRWKDSQYWLKEYGMDEAYQYAMVHDMTAPQLARAAMEDGPRLLTGFMDKVGPSLKEALGDIDITKPEGLELQAFMACQQAREARKYDIEPGIPRAAHEAYLNDMQNLDPERYARFDKAAKGITAINNAMLDVLVDVGRISPDTAKALKEKWTYYFPWVRIKPDSMKYWKGLGAVSNVSLGDPLGRRKGAGYQILNPIAATLQRVMRLYGVAVEQQKANLVREHLISHKATGWLGTKVDMPVTGFKTSLEEIADLVDSTFGKDSLEAESLSAAAEGKEGTKEGDLTIWRRRLEAEKGEPMRLMWVKDEAGNVKPEYWRFDPDLYASMTVSRPEMVHPLMKLLDATVGASTRLLKLGATGVNTFFAGKNVFRDMSAYFLRGGEGGLMDPFKALALYITSELSEKMGGEPNEYVRLYKRYGPTMSHEFQVDIDQVQKTIRKVLGKSQERTAAGMSKAVVDAMRDVMGVTEIGPRLAEMMAVLNKLGYDETRLKMLRESGQLPKAEDLDAAVYAAMERTTNFKRMGTSGWIVNRFCPFFNARLEGLVADVRAARKNPKRMFFRCLALAAGAMTYWWFRKDDEDWKDNPPWLKYGTWNYSSRGRTCGRFPMGEGLPLAIAGGTLGVLDWLNENDPSAVSKAFGSIVQNTVQGPWPALVTPILGAYVGKDIGFTGRDIVPQELKMHPLAEQYTPSTMWLSKKMGPMFHMAPATFDYLATNLTGGIYRHFGVPIESLAQRKAMNTADVPFIGGFALRSDYSQTVQEFYDAKDGATRRYNSARDKDKDNIPPTIEGEYRQFNEFGSLMADIRRNIKDVRTRDERFQYDKYVIGLARYAMGKDELDTRPNPFTATDAPPEVRRAVEKYLGNKVIDATAPRVTTRQKGETMDRFIERRDERERERDEAEAFLRSIGFTQGEAIEALKRERTARMWSTDTVIERSKRLGGL